MREIPMSIKYYLILGACVGSSLTMFGMVPKPTSVASGRTVISKPLASFVSACHFASKNETVLKNMLKDCYVWEHASGIRDLPNKQHIKLQYLAHLNTILNSINKSHLSEQDKQEFDLLKQNLDVAQLSYLKALVWEAMQEMPSKKMLILVLSLK